MGHVVPLRVLLAVWGSLLIFTVLTIGAISIDLGGFNLWLALIIALGKASLVALYFMHLRYERPFNAVLLIAALLFVILFIGLALMDVVQYEADLIPGYQPGMERL